MNSIFYLLAALLILPTTALAASSCENEAMDTLMELGIEAQLVKVTKSKSTSKSSKVSHYRHWHRTPLCEYGYVVVKSTPSCSVFETYTQNGCRIAGLKSYLGAIKR